MSSNRELSDWLTGYIKYTENTEPPLSYHTWAGISTVAGALQRKVWLEWGFEVIHPNMFVVLVGPSGKARKGVALGIAKSLLNEVPNISLSSEATTREAVISAMKRAITNFQAPDGTVKFHCSLTCFSEELSVFLGQNDIKFLSTLTDWYDSKDVWRYETVGRGLDSLQGLCFNLMGATAPDWLQSMLPQEAVGGGFTSRVIFVVEEAKGKSVPKYNKTDEDRRLEGALIRDLERISQLVGSFKFDTGGEEAYVQWYESEDKRLANGELPVDDPRFSSYAERRATHLRKLMMIMSVSRGDSLIITRGDYDRALKILTTTERKMHKTFGGLGQAKYAAVTEKILEYIRVLGTVSRTELMRKFYRDVDSQALKIIEEIMSMTKLIEITRVPTSGEVVYKWKGKQQQV